MAGTLYEYLKQNMFDGDDTGTVTQQISILLLEVIEQTFEWIADSVIEGGKVPNFDIINELKALQAAVVNRGSKEEILAEINRRINEHEQAVKEEIRTSGDRVINETPRP